MSLWQLEIAEQQVDGKAYLFTALNNIKGADDSVGETASKDASNHAFSVVGQVVNVTHFQFFKYNYQFSILVNII